jgi:hypothetical protein
MEEEKKTMEIVYLGRKSPKVIQTVQPELFDRERDMDKRKVRTGYNAGIGGGVTIIKSSGKARKYSFTPFKAIQVDEEVATILLKSSGSLFKRLDKDGAKPIPKAEVSTDGHVGDVHAEKLVDKDGNKILPSDVAKKIVEKEKGKTIDQIIADSKKKSK